MSGKIVNSKVLVTGGAGFIGSSLAEALLDQGNEVVVLDNFSTGKRANIGGFTGHPGFTLIEGDIRNMDDCRKAVNGAEYVLHQAALGSVPRSVKDPRTTNDVNITGFLNMLIATRDAGARRFVYASSSAVYGDHPGLPKVEALTGNPLSPYAVTKKVNELYASVFADLYGMEVVGLRYFNVFGRRQDPEGQYAAVIPRFIAALLHGRRPAIFGDGEQSRDFTYVQNVVQANQLAALAPSGEAVNTVYNIACGARYTLNQLTATLKELLSDYDASIGSIEPEYTGPRQGDILHSHASIDKARQLLGYEPAHDLKSGLAEAIGWYRENA
jgi:UDP-N-acetylglucosamine 4-epimerase